MSIVRAPRPASRFTTLRNDVIRDDRLSYRASGVLHDILSRPDNWSTNAEALVRARRQEGRAAIRTALKELQAAGYLVHEKVRDPETGQVRTISYIYDEPRTTVDEEFLRRRENRRKPPAPKKPASGKPADGKLGPLRKNDTKDYQEEPDKIVGIEASSDGLQLATGEAAPSLARRRPRNKTINDPLVKNQDADNADAVRAAAEILDDEEARLLVDYLRRDRNASTTYGHVMHLGETGVVEMYSLAEEWASGLAADHAHAVEYCAERGFASADANRIADAIRDAVAIRSPRHAINNAINPVVNGRDANRVLAAVADVVDQREAERRNERRERVRRQREQTAA